MRTGKFGALDPIMPWIVFRHLSDADLAAIHAFLSTIAPGAHAIDNHSPPARCVLCEQEHGLGASNRVEKPKGIRLDPRILAGYAGTYRSAEYGFGRVIAFRKGRLFGREEAGPEIELIPVSRERFLAPGWLAPIEFVRDLAGRVTGHLSLEVDDVRLDRVNE